MIFPHSFPAARAHEEARAEQRQALSFHLRGCQLKSAAIQTRRDVIQRKRTLLESALRCNFFLFWEWLGGQRASLRKDRNRFATISDQLKLTALQSREDVTRRRKRAFFESGEKQVRLFGVKMKPEMLREHCRSFRSFHSSLFMENLNGFWLATIKTWDGRGDLGPLDSNAFLREKTDVQVSQSVTQILRRQGLTQCPHCLKFVSKCWPDVEARASCSQKAAPRNWLNNHMQLPAIREVSRFVSKSFLKQVLAKCGKKAVRQATKLRINSSKLPCFFVRHHS